MKPLVSQALGLEPQEGLVLYVVHVKSSPPPRQLGSHCPTWGVGGQDHSALPRAAVLKQRQVLLGLFLSGQNHSSTDLSRVFRQETPSLYVKGKEASTYRLGRAARAAHSSSLLSAHRTVPAPRVSPSSLEPSPSPSNQEAPWDRGPSPHQPCALIPMGKTKTGPRPLPLTPTPIRPGQAVSCRGSGCPWGPGGP